MPRYRPQKQTVGWCRWLVSNGMPAADVCFVLEIPAPVPPHIARALTPSARGAPRPRRPSPDRRGGRRPAVTLRCRTATKARRLTELGYTTSRIAALLGLPPGRVARLIREGTHRFSAVHSPWEESAARAERAEWTEARRRLAELAAAPIADQAAAAELPAVTAAAAPPPVNPWNGPAGFHLGRAKLTEAAVAELRDLRAAGWSTGDLAAAFRVSRATVCYALRGRTWFHV